MRNAKPLACLSILGLALLAGGVRAQSENVEIKTIPVRGGVSMLTGQGGNIGVSAGDDGVLLIDDQFAPLTDKIRAAVTRLSPDPIRFVVNTHWHGDHTGGNENLGKAGVLIVAHDNVRKRMSVEQFMAAFDKKVPASPAVALPVVTFTEEVTFHLNDDDIHVIHVASAHTDGDSIIHFPGANAIHTGDVFFNGMYPFIDVGSGGSIDGMIAAAERCLALAGPETKIIPGHGPLADRAALAAYRDMLVDVRGAVMALVRAGQTREQVVAAKPSAKYDERWGAGFIPPERMVGQVFDSLKP